MAGDRLGLFEGHAGSPKRRTFPLGELLLAGRTAQDAPPPPLPLAHREVSRPPMTRQGAVGVDAAELLQRWSETVGLRAGSRERLLAGCGVLREHGQSLPVLCPASLTWRFHPETGSHAPPTRIT